MGVSRCAQTGCWVVGSSCSSVVPDQAPRLDGWVDGPHSIDSTPAWSCPADTRTVTLPDQARTPLAFYSPPRARGLRPFNTTRNPAHTCASARAPARRPGDPRRRCRSVYGARDLESEGRRFAPTRASARGGKTRKLAVQRAPLLQRERASSPGSCPELVTVYGSCLA